MGNIDIINRIAEDRQKAKDIAYRVQSKCASGDSRTFAEVLQEELDKAKRGENHDTSKRIFKLSRRSRNSYQ